jgi:MGT family glycosyltransferase
MSRRPVIAVFETGGHGHYRALRPLIAGLAARGARVVVFTIEAFADDARALGAEFCDLYENRSRGGDDDRSIPLPSRSVSFAAYHAPELVEAARAIGTELVVHDTFAVIGTVVANALGVPRVNVGNAHSSAPQANAEVLATYPRLDPAPECLHACAVLEREYGLLGANPMSYLDNTSPDLNLHRGPVALLDADERSALAPLAPFGSLPDAAEADATTVWFPPGPGQRVHVSFGTVIWRYFTEPALDAMAVIVDALAQRDPPARVLLSVGGADVDEAVLERLRSSGADVRHWVETPSVLAQTDVFVCHCGVGSMQEAIRHEVPMVGYPIFGDQPIVARRAAAAGLGVTLGSTLRAPLVAQDVHRALDEVEHRRAEMTEALREARARELEVIAGRPAVVERILALVR